MTGKGACNDRLGGIKWQEKCIKRQARGIKRQERKCKKHRQRGAGNIGKGALKIGQGGVKRQAKERRKQQYQTIDNWETNAFVFLY